MVHISTQVARANRPPEKDALCEPSRHQGNDTAGFLDVVGKWHVLSYVRKAAQGSRATNRLPVCSPQSRRPVSVERAT